MKVSKEQILNSFRRFAVLFDVPEHSRSDELPGIWYEIFCLEDADAFNGACSEWMRMGTRWPLPADLLAVMDAPGAQGSTAPTED